MPRYDYIDLPELENVAPDARHKQERYRNNNPEQVAKDNVRRYRQHSSRPVKPFAGVDGEGGTVQGFHRYVLLRAGEHVLTEPEPKHVGMFPSVGSGLAWHDILDWLCHLPVDKEYVSFYFDYDVTMILRQCKPSQIKNLVLKGFGRIGNDMDGWWFVHYRPRSEVTACPAVRDPSAPNGWASDPSRGHFIRISDTSKFFQCAFMKVITDWQVCTVEELEFIGHGKESREVFQFIDSDERAEVTEYNHMECVKLCEVMDQFRAACDIAELRPARWQGPGYLAKAAFRKYGVPRRKNWEERIPKEITIAGTSSLYGGWFECSQFGPVPGIIGPERSPGQLGYLARFDNLIVEDDLKSAYPWAATYLPCLRHSRFEKRTPRDGEYALQFAEVTYDGYSDENGYIRKPDGTYDLDFPYYMGLPHRDKTGRVCRPLHTTGWYWNFELNEARHQNVNVHESYVWVSDCRCDSFGFIHDLFELRQELERTHKNRGKPIKLGLNSLYGCLAQRVGSRPFTNHVAASFITAFTRARLMRTIHEHSCERGLQCGSNVVMVATDAIFFQGDPGFGEKKTDELGAWERKEHRNGIFVVQGGVYWPRGESAESKTRGVPQNIIRAHQTDFETSYRRMVESGRTIDGDVTLTRRLLADGSTAPCKRFIGIREGVHRNLPYTGRFEPFERTLGFSWASKRNVHPRMNTRQGRRTDQPTWTVPRAVYDPLSTPYDKILENVTPLGFLPYMSEDNQMDALNDSPDWLPQIESLDPDDDYDWDDAMRSASSE